MKLISVGVSYFGSVQLNLIQKLLLSSNAVFFSVFKRSNLFMHFELHTATAQEWNVSVQSGLIYFEICCFFCWAHRTLSLMSPRVAAASNSSNINNNNKRNALHQNASVDHHYYYYFICISMAAAALYIYHLLLPLHIRYHLFCALIYM